jgi:hypothetical protein
MVDTLKIIVNPLSDHLIPWTKLYSNSVLDLYSLFRVQTLRDPLGPVPVGLVAV